MRLEPVGSSWIRPDPAGSAGFGWIRRILFQFVHKRRVDTPSHEFIQKSNRMRVKGNLMRLWYSRKLFHACPDGTTIEAWLKVKAEEVYLENPFVP